MQNNERAKLIECLKKINRCLGDQVTMGFVAFLKSIAGMVINSAFN
jgi:hypothetical protein